MAADGRLPLDKLSGAGAAIDDVPRWTGTRWTPGSAGGGGAMLGYAELFFTFTTTTNCNDNASYADSSAVTSSSGSPGVTADGAGNWHYDTDSVDSVYITTAVIDPTAISSPSASDVTSFWADFGLAVGTSAIVGDTWRRIESTGIYLIASPSGTVLPRIRATCTTTTRTFQASASVYVARFPAP